VRDRARAGSLTQRFSSPSSTPLPRTAPQADKNFGASRSRPFVTLRELSEGKTSPAVRGQGARQLEVELLAGAVQVLAQHPAASANATVAAFAAVEAVAEAAEAAQPPISDAPAVHGRSHQSWTDICASPCDGSGGGCG
jgi:hypothetical protein